MIKKIIINPNLLVRLRKFKLKQFVKRGGKIQKIKAQKVPATFKHADETVAQKSFKQTFGKLKEHETIRIADATELAAKELATTTANVKWQKQITKFVTRKRSTLAGRVKTWRDTHLSRGYYGMGPKPKEATLHFSKVKKGIKKAKIREYNKAIGAADTTAKNIYQKTLTMFTGKSGADPLKHKLVETKFITTKKLRKGPMDDWSKSMMSGKGFHGESFAKLKGAAYHEKGRMIKFANMPGNKTKDGQVKWNKFWKQEQKRKREWAQSFPKKKK